jgi:hypothetical protein
VALWITSTAISFMMLEVWWLYGPRYLGGWPRRVQSMGTFGMLCSFFIHDMLWSSKPFISQGSQRMMLSEGRFNAQSLHLMVKEGGRVHSYSLPRKYKVITSWGQSRGQVLWFEVWCIVFPSSHGGFEAKLETKCHAPDICILILLTSKTCIKMV